MGINNKELKVFLDEKVTLYNQPRFIETDPIQIPRQFGKKEDIEIAAFLSATIAWGQRVTIIKNANKLMRYMGMTPYEFIMDTSEKDWDDFTGFKHRTFNGADTLCFLRSIKNIYQNYGGLENVFTQGYRQTGSIDSVLVHVRKIFFEVEHDARTQKHFSNILSGASAKRLNMFLRWMVRKDNCGVDFGLWLDIPMHALYLPLDVHTGNVARKLGLLQRKQNDWKAVQEVTQNLRAFDAIDPIKYDFALFGLGVFERF